MREIRLICKKELSRVLTDRKMLFSIFLLPAIIMVVVMNVMTSFSENLENDVKSHAPIRSLGRVSVPMWPFTLSGRLWIVALVGRYPTN